MSKNDSWRVQLLSDAEVIELYALPKFDDIDREFCFSLDDHEHLFLTQYSKPHTKLYFILQLGYFRAKKMFYKFSMEFIMNDVAYVIRRYFPETIKSSEFQNKIWKENQLKQKNDILALFQYREWSPGMRPMVITHLTELIKRFPKGNDTLRELFVFLEKERIVIPSYRTLQDLFTEVFAFERERLNKIMLTLPKNIQEELESIIKNDDGFTQLNVIRNDQKDFKYTALKDEVKKSRLLTQLYVFSKTFIPLLQISTNSVRYYASLAEHYTASRIRKLNKPQQWLYILCFISYRYKSFMDNLITSFMLYVKTLMQDAKQYAKSKEEEYNKGIMLEFPKLVQFLQWFSSEKTRQYITPQDFSQAGFDILSQKMQVEIAGYIAGIAFDHEAAKWEFYEKSSRHIALYLRPILLEVSFEFYTQKSKMMQLIEFLRHFYKTHHDSKHFTVPEEIVETFSNTVIKQLVPSQKSQGIHASRFEFYVYYKMYHALDRGKLFCNDSISYCDLDYDLVPDKLVDQSHDIAAQYGYNKIAVYCDEHLDQVLSELDAAWERTNNNIANGENRGIHIQSDEKGNTTWQLTYDAEKANESKFFSGLPKIDAADAVKIISNKLALWPVFTHLKHRYVKCHQPNPLALLGGVLSNAFGFGTKNMAEISNLSYNYLREVENDFIHVENLLNVNDVVSNFTHSLPINRIWDLIENKIIGDGDGQKYETSSHTIQSRYSSKYFGSYKGISVYSLIVNHIPVNAKNIGPNEYEGHHLFDMLYNNNTDISIDMMTGDGHSVNQVNFVALDAINITFIPCINNIRSESENLYCVDSPEKYNGFIKPYKKINTALIRSQRRGIIRILLSLILQENTQAVIVRKLSSHKRYCRLRSAFWEYNKIFKSMHILNLINDIMLRKVLKHARNRTESYHQMQRFIRRVHSGVLNGKKIVDNTISTQAARFVANCIIAYNAMLLNEVYLRVVKRIGEERAKKVMNKISPVAWQHLIFTGRYRFTDAPLGTTLEMFIDMLEKKLDEIIAK